MIFSRPCQHAIRALMYLASHQDAGLCQVQEIAEAEDLPPAALALVLQSLVRSGLVKSQKGPRGGFSLARPTADTTLYQIMEACGDMRSLSQCTLGLEVCSDERPCPVHSMFRDIRHKLVQELKTVTVAELVQVIRREAGSKPQTTEAVRRVQKNG